MVHDVISMLDCQGLLAIESDLDKSHICFRKPETVNLLVLTHKVRSFYPERKLLCWMAFNPDNRIVFNINPHLAFKQILVSPLRDCPYDEALVRPHLLLAKRLQGVVCRGDDAAVMLLTSRCFDLAGDQWVQRQTANHDRSFFGGDHKLLLVRRQVLHPP